MPVNIVSDLNEEFLQGGEVSLECEVSNLARPPHSLNWQRGGQVITLGDKSRFQNPGIAK